MEKSDQLFKDYLKVLINNEKLDIHIPEICSSFKKISLNRNDFFVKQGEICKYFCFIEAGVLQHAIDITGDEKTTYLALRNTCTSSLKSFINKTSSRKSIKAISDCNLWVITLEVFDYLLNNNEGFNRFYYNLIENQIYLIDDYRIDLLTLTPEERYYKLLANDPQLLRQVPLHYLASFLGISTRHMSRIRKNIN